MKEWKDAYTGYWIAEWIPYMHAYRVYDTRKPGSTIAYEDDLEEAKAQAERQECRLVIVDTDEMHTNDYLYYLDEEWRAEQ